ncbi:MAG: hypothetical protein Q8M93_09050 [Polaromonas sp.]|nr:hypothetical protein [Polaromonas sp.]MDP2451935.1 hypothetical protein [Polaromonas sp.]MDP3247096.1 hypothetical protein [Polaromonas sp.]MDP3756297.1 hypothetical protein [Polaromonas sp.]MDP3828030.1 hypothetical protein [Polaromonas sp.]
MMWFIHASQRVIRHAIVLSLSLGLFMSAWGAGGSQALGPAALRAKHLALGPQLASNQFQGPLYLASTESAQQLEGDVYALVKHPFGTVSAELSDPRHWCDVLILHLNIKFCRARLAGGGTQLDVRIGRKHDRPLVEASTVLFSYRTAAVEPEYLAIELDAADGPLDTHDYKILLEAVPIAQGQSFIHMRYSFAYGRAGRVAMQLYLATLGRGKVGFTPTAAASPGEPPALIGGVRGVVERNTMRYYLAIESYLDALAVPPPQRFEKGLEGWFAATQKYTRQLYEVDRAAYLDMKRKEYLRQQTAP